MVSSNRINRDKTVFQVSHYPDKNILLPFNTNFIDFSLPFLQ